MNTAIELLREARNKWLKHQHSCNAWMSFNKCDCGLDDFFARLDAYLASPEPSVEEVQEACAKVCADLATFDILIDCLTGYNTAAESIRALDLTKIGKD